MPRRPPTFTATGAFYGDQVTLVAARTVTAAGSSSLTQSDEFHTLRLSSVVSAVAGTSPSITVTVEHSGDGTTWSALGSFPAQTAAGTQRKVFVGLDRYVRCSWAVAGTTPSVTFSVSGEGL